MLSKVGGTSVDVNIESASLIAMNSGQYGIHISSGKSTPDYNHAVKINGSVRSRNVTITGLPEGCKSALLAVIFRNLTVSDTTIKSNRCTAIFLLQSTTFFQANVLLANNTAVSGGGMYLLSKSLIVLDSSTRLQLYNNTAEKFGGGIFVYNSFVELYYCFAISIGRTAKPTIEFDENRAYGSGDNLHGEIPDD